MIQLSTRVNNELNQSLLDWCEATNTTKNKAVIMALVRFLDGHESISLKHQLREKLSKPPIVPSTQLQEPTPIDDDLGAPSDDLDDDAINF